MQIGLKETLELMKMAFLSRLQSAPYYDKLKEYIYWIWI